MKNSELIKRLQQLPPNAEVYFPNFEIPQLEEVGRAIRVTDHDHEAVRGRDTHGCTFPIILLR